MYITLVQDFLQLSFLSDYAQGAAERCDQYEKLSLLLISLVQDKLGFLDPNMKLLQPPQSTPQSTPKQLQTKVLRQGTIDSAQKKRLNTGTT
jgi:hypothetical protein